MGKPLHLSRITLLMRLLMLLLPMLLHRQAEAQGGIRFIPWHSEKIEDDGSFGTANYGLGYDHDLNRRLSLGMEMLLGGETDMFTIRYRSAYHFSPNDNDGGSAYFGPNLAVRWLDRSSETLILVPVGFRVGYRGTLPGGFADIFAGYQYQIGAPSKPSTSSGSANRIVGGSYMIGIHFGFGWDKHERD